MPRNRTEFKDGSVREIDTEAGPDAYPAGGFEITPDLGRIGNATVEAQDLGYTARVLDITADSNLVVGVVATDGTGEVAADTDLSGVTFTYTAYRQ